MEDHLDIEDAAQLTRYLRSAGRIGPCEAVRIRVLSGGVSNRTVLVERADGETWVLKQALAKLRVATDWFSDVSRIHREASGLRHLARLAPPGTIPAFVFEDFTHGLLAMAAVPEPHANWKNELLAGRIAATQVRQCAQLLARIHVASWQQRSHVELEFRDRSFFESLRLDPYYGHAAESLPAARGFLNKLAEQTRSRRLTLVHGDFSPKNMLVHDSRLVLLDHEVIHWGDPAFDLGFLLTHLLSKAHHLPAQREAFAGAAQLFFSTYAEGVHAADWRAEATQGAVGHTLGCLLARVAGKSPLEYLSSSDRDHQQAVVMRLIQAPPSTIPHLITDFVSCLSSTN